MCNECDFQSSISRKMRSHKKKMHGIPFEYVCESCGQDFLNEGHLKRHQLTHESDDSGSRQVQKKDHHCDICEYKSDRPSEVKRHSNKVHSTIDIEMKCQECNFEARQLHELESHLQESHCDKVQLKSCDKCKFSAYHDPTMKFHVGSMHDVKCELCSYITPSPSLLKRHISTKHLKQCKKEP